MTAVSFTKKMSFTTSQTGSCCSKSKAYVHLVWIWERLWLQSVLKSSVWNPNKSWSKQVLLPKMVGMVFWFRVWSVVQWQLEVCGSYTSQTQACWTSMTGNESLIHKADCSVYYESQRWILIFLSEVQKHLILGNAAKIVFYFFLNCWFPKAVVSMIKCYD